MPGSCEFRDREDQPFARHQRGSRQIALQDRRRQRSGWDLARRSDHGQPEVRGERDERREALEPGNILPAESFRGEPVRDWPLRPVLRHALEMQGGEIRRKEGHVPREIARSGRQLDAADERRCFDLHVDHARRKTIEHEEALGIAGTRDASCGQLRAGKRCAGQHQPPAQDAARDYREIVSNHVAGHRHGL